eukprot:UN04137
MINSVLGVNNSVNSVPDGGGSFVQKVVKNYFGVYDNTKARIYCGGQCLELGSYMTPEAAAKAYDRKAYELYGPHQKFNFFNQQRGQKLDHIWESQGSQILTIYIRRQCTKRKMGRP